MRNLIFILLITPLFLIGQAKNSNNYQDDLLNNTGLELRINYKTENKGTPYLYDEWKEGYLVINDSVISPQKKIQIDLEKGELIVGIGEGRGTIIDDKAITGFAITKDNSINKHLYARLEPMQFEDSDRTSHFYEVVSNFQKSDYLIKEEQKYLYDPNKSRGYQTENSFPMEWKKRTYYYIKNSSDKYVKTKLNKKAILKVLADKSREMKSYVGSRKINFKKEEDVVKVLVYYHSL
ncbi:MAG: hypothetical protein COB73_01265 [Flavobacteriaceae bacterium]|nr:MAG: hypothetical protein COB73_01265 [Flavobacteriaceae bacterium]